MKATIYTAYHKPAPLLKSRSVQPIHVGRALASAPLHDMIGDDTGAHISDRNGRYCELTALYWAWKNDTDSSHIGLMHYRRVLDFAGRNQADRAEVFVNYFNIDSYLDDAEAWLASDLSCDIVVPVLHEMGKTVEENYRAGHAPIDFDLTRDIIAREHPDYLTAFDTVSGGQTFLLANMFLMRRALLEEYCEWLFDILGKVERAEVSREHYSPYQSRYLGFLAERLLTVFVHKLASERPNLTIRHTNIVNIGEATVAPYLSDDSLNGREHVNIAFSADRAFVPHAAAMLSSVLAHSNPDRRYNFFFLHSDVDSYAREMLRGMFARHRNTSWHEISVGSHFDESYRSASRAPSNATYNRFLLFDLLPSLDRLLYLDVDMIALGDVAEIFDTDMGDALIAAVPDYIMTRTLTGPTPTVDPDIPDLYTYHREVLGLEDRHISRYFNAGLLLFNFAKMDVRKTGAELLKMAKTTKFLFRDQDILNSYFKDDYLKLPARYNVCNTKAAGYGRVPKKNHAEAMKAKQDPFIIHYAAKDYKPWLPRAVPFAEHYWSTLIKTPFYGEVLAFGKDMDDRRSGVHRLKSGLVRYGKALAERIPILRWPLRMLYRVLKRCWKWIGLRR